MPYTSELMVNPMPNMTFAVPEELHKEMRRHKDVRWSEVARRALAREINRLHIYDRLLADSRLTETDAVELGRVIRRRQPPKRR
jgi:hypothetical protein